MNKTTKMSLVNLGGEVLTVVIGVVVAIGVNTMKKDINKHIDKKDIAEQEVKEKRNIANLFKKK